MNKGPELSLEESILKGSEIFFNKRMWWFWRSPCRSHVHSGQTGSPQRGKQSQKKCLFVSSPTDSPRIEEMKICFRSVQLRQIYGFHHLLTQNVGVNVEQNLISERSYWNILEGLLKFELHFTGRRLKPFIIYIVWKDSMFFIQLMKTEL